nr:hypothetical protein [Tanacetum cinerariifolium]
MDTLSLDSKYLNDLEECMDDGDSKIAKEAKLFNALENKSVVIEVDNQKIVIFSKAPLRAFGEPFMRYSIPCKIDGQGAWDAELDLVDSENYVTKEVLENIAKGENERGVGHQIQRARGIKAYYEVLENYAIYKKKLDEILIGKERLNKKEFSEEDKVGIIEHELPKKMCDLENYVLPVKINGVVEMVALVDTRASVSVLPYSLYNDLGLGNPRPYQAYMVDLLILDILVDPELPLLLGRPFLRTYGAVIGMGRGTLCIDNGVIHHTYFPKPHTKSYVEAFEMEGEDDWLGCFEVGRGEDGNVKYGPVGPLFIDIEDDIERLLAMEAYFNPLKNVIVFKKLVDFLGLLPVQLKNLEWGNKGYGSYKKVDGDGDWHARFEIVTPSGRKFNQSFKTKTTTRKLSGKFKTEDLLRFSHFLD